MHLAESREELELLRHGTGPLRAFLEEIGAWDATAIPSGSRPIDYLRLLASAHRALVIHGNYLDDEETAFLAANAERMSVVYCPRTHDWFAHRAYPLEKMLAAGVTVALGTDGRGSSPDLSLLGEMRFAARQHPAVPLDRILQLGTVLGAKALGRERHVGTLEPGKQADLAIVALPDRDAADPHELLFDFGRTGGGALFPRRGNVFQSRFSEPPGQLFLHVGQRDPATSQQHQQVIEQVGRFVGQTVAAILVGHRRGVEHLGRFLAQLESDRLDAALKQFRGVGFCRPFGLAVFDDGHQPREDRTGL